MIVLCVDRNAFPWGVEGEPCDELKNGDSYTVIDVFIDGEYIYYVLEEIGNSMGYWENCFMRTSQVDEMEGIKKREMAY